jgi:hypothetical protein
MGGLKAFAIVSNGVLALSLGLAPAALADEPASQVLAEGVVTDRLGAAAAGASVVAYAWPSNDELAAMSPGSRFDLVPVAHGVSGRGGAYRLSATTDQAARFRDSHGNLNLELVTSANGSVASTTVGLSPLTPNRLGRLGSARVSALRLQTAPATVTAMGEGTQALPLGGPVPCGGSFQRDLGLHTVWVGGHYSTTTGVLHDLEYSRGSTSSLGVGSSLSGRFGTFTASGTTSLSTNGTVGFPATAGRQHDYTYFDYGSYFVGCAGNMRHVVRARYWAGGAHYWTPPSAPPIASWNCAWHDKGTTFAQDRTSAYRFAAGADVSNVIGIDLSSQTGYSAATRVTFTFKDRGAHLCGTNGLPGRGAPGRLVATR